MVMFKLAEFGPSVRAGVAQHGQRRKTEALIPQGFVGSNPISRTFNHYKLSALINTSRKCPEIKYLIIINDGYIDGYSIRFILLVKVIV
jgi:hypothetical protein